MTVVAASVVIAATTLSHTARIDAQNAQPSARLIPATALQLPGASDSNAPAIWERVAGLERLFVLTSISGQSTRHTGLQLGQLVSTGRVRFVEHPGHGVWFEGVVPDVDGTWYGFYHQERPAEVCGDSVRTIPRIGAARSTDFGATWEDLGVVLEAPPNSHDCASANRYFVGGVGDFSVMLDASSQYLYFFFSQYPNREFIQGVSAARLPWADRDNPTGKAAVWWRSGSWIRPRRFTTDDGGERYFHAAGTPIHRVADGWHGDMSVDAFWGPSIHYNTYLQRYVMLLNRATDSNWTQEGIYISFTDRLDDPGSWTTPQRLLASGRWYPQVIGSEAGTGTDKLAGQRARFFMSGRSEYLIEFVK
jgi:hypothetical protein